MYYPDSPAPTPLLTRVGSKLAGNYAEGFFNKQPIERAAAHAHAQSATPTRGHAALRLAETHHAAIIAQVKAHLQAMGWSSAVKPNTRWRNSVAASPANSPVLKAKSPLEWLLINDQVNVAWVSPKIKYKMKNKMETNRDLKLMSQVPMCPEMELYSSNMPMFTFSESIWNI